MDNMVVEDEKKPFDAEAGGPEPDREPDPDEIMAIPMSSGLSTGHWLVKVPKFLLERWLSIEQEGVPLASLRYYANAVNPVTGRVPRIVLTLPPDPTSPSGATVDQYELDVVQDAVANALVVAEAHKPESAPGSRARLTSLVGHVAHECNMRPRFDDAYRARMKARSQQANTPARQIVVLDQAAFGSQGELNRLSAGVANGRGFSDLVKQKPKLSKGSFERMARIPKNQLLDALFALFRERPRWPVRALRERTQQPEQYLKETLAEIAALHRSGEHSGQWELKPNFREEIKGEAPGPSTAALYARPDIAKGEYAGEYDEEDEDEDDEEDEDDMEEVAT